MGRKKLSPRFGQCLASLSLSPVHLHPLLVQPLDCLWAAFRSCVNPLRGPHTNLRGCYLSFSLLRAGTILPPRPLRLLPLRLLLPSLVSPCTSRLPLPACLPDHVFRCLYRPRFFAATSRARTPLELRHSIGTSVYASAYKLAQVCDRVCERVYGAGNACRYRMSADFRGNF